MTGSRASTQPSRCSYVWAAEAVVAVALLVFVVLGVMAHNHPGPFTLDKQAAHLTAANHSGWFHIGAFVTFFGGAVVVAVMTVLVAGYVWWRYRDLIATAMVPISSAVGGLLNNLAKMVVGRPRPPTAVYTHASGFGYPSGHTAGFTAFAVAVAGVFILLHASRAKKILASTIATLASVAVALSRVVVGAHWLTDVIGGLLLGGAIGITVTLVALRLRRRDEIHGPPL
jgi:undecaprenyl-diphosphatase